MPKVFVIKDDWDQTTVCVVQSELESDALNLAQEQYASVIEGDLYAIPTELWTIPTLKELAESIREEAK